MDVSNGLARTILDRTVSRNCLGEPMRAKCFIFKAIREPPEDQIILSLIVNKFEVASRFPEINERKY